jgi:hypothetical protein
MPRDEDHKIFTMIKFLRNLIKTRSILSGTNSNKNRKRYTIAQLNFRDIEAGTNYIS